MRTTERFTFSLWRVILIDRCAHHQMSRAVVEREVELCMWLRKTHPFFTSGSFYRLAPHSVFHRLKSTGRGRIWTCSCHPCRMSIKLSERKTRLVTVIMSKINFRATRQDLSKMIKKVKGGRLPARLGMTAHKAPLHDVSPAATWLTLQVRCVLQHFRSASPTALVPSRCIRT